MSGCARCARLSRWRWTARVDCARPVGVAALVIGAEPIETLGLRERAQERDGSATIGDLERLTGFHPAEELARSLARLSYAGLREGFEPGLALWWSGPPRTFDLSERAERCRLYEIVLREGRPADIEGVVDGVLLREAWPDLVLPRGLAAAWAPLIAPAHDKMVRRASTDLLARDQ